MSDFITEYNKVKPVLHKAFSEIGIKDGDNVISIDDVVDAALKMAHPEDNDYIPETDDKIRKKIELLSLVGFCASYKQIKVDSARLEAMQLGYASCFDWISKFDTMIRGRHITVESFNIQLYNSLLSCSRKVSMQAYLSDDTYALEDIKNICDLIATDSDFEVKNSELLHLIEKKYRGQIDSALAIIKSRYTYILNGCVGGIDDYKGVFILSRDKDTVSCVCNNGVKRVEPDETLYDYAQALQDRYDYKNILDINKGRQFDKKLIINAFEKADGALNQLVPIYFPYKLLEIVSKCEWKKKTQLLNYTQLSNKEVGNIRTYVSSLSKHFNQDIVNLIYTYLLVKLKPDDVNDEDELVKIIVDFLNINNKTSDEKDIDNSKVIGNLITNLIQYYVDCVTTAFVLVNLKTGKQISPTDNMPTGGEDIFDIRIRVCARHKKIDDSMDLKYKLSNESFFMDIAAQEHNINKNDISQEKVDYETNALGQMTNFIKCDYFYTFDKKKAAALPQFAYKALLALREKNENLSWEKILLGRQQNGNLVTASKDSKIAIQKDRVHYIYAGSRAGKGVMCYNIFSTALASGIPMFYLDRKPDTSTVMRKAANDMFCFNGGDYQHDFDYDNLFLPDNYVFQIPPYAKEVFADRKTKFDFAYFKGIMLYLTMICYADVMKDSTLTNAFSKGSMLVVDEFTNYTNEFLLPLLTATGKGWFAGLSTKKKLLQEITQYTTNKAKVEKQYEKDKENAKGDEVAIQNAETTKAASLTTNSIDLLKLYFTAIDSMYERASVGIKALQNAGGNAQKNMHIFIIGQDLKDIRNAVAVKSDYFGEPGTDALHKNIEAGSIPIIKLFNLIGNVDVIAGYQSDRPTYLAQTKSNVTKNKLNADERMFAYHSYTGGISADDFDKLINTIDTLKTDTKVSEYLYEWSYFKPFLILNNAVDVPECLQYKPEYLSDEEFEGLRKGKLSVDKFNLEPTPMNNEVVEFTTEDGNTGRFALRSQYIGQSLNAINSAGLSYADFIDDNLAGEENGKKVLNSGVGFEGYMETLAGANITKIQENMNQSGIIATNFVQNVLHYPGTWVDYVCDFRPEWLISPGDIAEGVGVRPIENRLSDSFFITPFVILKLYEDMKDSLGSLYNYYGKVQNDVSEDKESVDEILANIQKTTSDITEDINSKETKQELNNNNQQDITTKLDTIIKNSADFFTKESTDNEESQVSINQKSTYSLEEVEELLHQQKEESERIYAKKLEEKDIIFAKALINMRVGATEISDELRQQMIDEVVAILRN